MDCITVRVSDLKALVKEMSSKGIEYAVLTFLEADKIGDDSLPPCIYPQGGRSDSTDLVDYDELEEVPEDEFDPSIFTGLRSNTL